MRVLLLNSDLAANRGDRAIAEGIVQLVREIDPAAQVTGISQFPERDRAWFGIDVLDMDFQSLSPVDLWRLCREARRHDVVLWGGGEILKDYTNKAALWYWVLKVTLLSLVNPRIIGAFQGIGPTRSAISRRLIAFVVGRTRVFVVRDDESREKLLSWGADPDRVVASADPAVVPRPEPVRAAVKRDLTERDGLAPDFFDSVVCIGPRDWFHYRQSGILPFKYRRRLQRLLRRGQDSPSGDPRHDVYVRHLHELVVQVGRRSGANLLFMPMHMAEDDAELSRSLAAAAREVTGVCVLDRDDLSPADLRSLVAASRAMIGFRLHSNIIGISSGVPSLNLYYVDKGRVFFDQVGMSRWAMPIEATLEPDFADRTADLFVDLLEQGDDVRAGLDEATEHLRAKVRAALRKALDVA